MTIVVPCPRLRYFFLPGAAPLDPGPAGAGEEGATATAARADDARIGTAAPDLGCRTRRHRHRPAEG